MVKIPERFCNLCSFVAGSFFQFHIGGILTAVQKLSDTLSCFLPGYHLPERSKTGSFSSGKMNTLVVEPHADLNPIQFEPIATTVKFRQTLCNLLGGFSLHIFQRHRHSEIGFVTASDKHLVNFVLGERKSRGRLALCFINKVNLFCFGKEKVQA